MNATEPVATTLRRRLVTIPATLLIGGAWLALLPLLVPLAIGIDVLRRRRFGLARTVLVFAAWAVADIVGLFACGVVALFRLDHWYTIQQVYNQFLYQSLMRIFGMRTEIEGLEGVPRGPLILMSRHAGYWDSFLPCSIFGRLGLHARFVMKRALLWLPCLDIVAGRVRNCFVGGRGVDDRAQIMALLDDVGPLDFVVLFPEGGRYTPQRRYDMIRKRAGTPLGEQAARLRHLLPPRLGGALALLAHPSAKPEVWFCAHAGLERAGSVAHLASGTLVGTTVRVRFWRFAHDAIPHDADAQAEWLFARWLEMDQWLSSVRR